MNRFKPSRNSLYFGLAVLVLASVPVVAKSDYILMVLINVMFGIYLCVCWNLVFGYTGLFSLGHQAFLGIGAYTSTLLYLNYKISPWFGMFVGAIVSAILAIFITFICYRYRIRGFFFAIVTLAFGMLMQNLFLTWDYAHAAVGLWLVHKDAPLDYYFMNRASYYWIILALVIIALLVTYFIQKSRIGSYLIAIRENEDAAEAVGVPSSRYKVIVMAISAFMISLAGTFYAQFYLYIHPDTVFAIHSAITMQVGTMMGGAGTLFGPVIGWTFFALFDEMLRWLPIGSLAMAAITRITYGLMLMFIILFFPIGIIGLGAKLRRSRTAAIGSSQTIRLEP
jgi:branched-chain amino acid transport system permease protein